MKDIKDTDKTRLVVVASLAYRVSVTVVEELSIWF